MTVTAQTTNPIQLTNHDHIIATGDADPLGSRRAVSDWALSASLHLYADTPIRVRVYDHEDRAVIRFGTHGADLDVYANAGQLDRLITLLSAARQRLP
jgi:hypothetical protein